MWYEKILSRNLVPESIIRFAIRRMIKKSLRQYRAPLASQQKYLMEFIEDLKQQPIAIHTSTANEQHYELPAEFFELVLGKYLKYSCCLWSDLSASKQSVANLVEAEENMLKLTCERADLVDGQKIMDLGCGWGSLTIYMAKNYPKSTITAVSNSKIQKSFIERRVKEEQLSNVTVIKADIKDFTTEQKFDRIVSVEMFEHMRNYQKLMNKLATFLVDAGKLFIHIFSHKDYPYLFDATDETNWMAKYFFAGGTMPSANLLLYFQEEFVIEKQWKVNGLHYTKTLNSWLWKMKQQKKTIKPILAKVYGKKQSIKWWTFWKVFFIANAEVFGYYKGREWFVSHYLFQKR